MVKTRNTLVNFSDHVLLFIELIDQISAPTYNHKYFNNLSIIVAMHIPTRS